MATWLKLFAPLGEQVLDALCSLLDGRGVFIGIGSVFAELDALGRFCGFRFRGLALRLLGLVGLSGVEGLEV